MNSTSSWGESTRSNGLPRDSKRDHGSIVEVLTAYLRHRSQERAAPPGRQPVYAADVPRRITADLQAVLTVLARRKTANERRHGGMSLDLLGADLRDAVFFGNFDRAILRSAEYVARSSTILVCGTRTLSGRSCKRPRSTTRIFAGL